VTDFFFVGGPMRSTTIDSVNWAEPTQLYNKPIDGSAANQSFYFTSLAGRGEPGIDVLIRMAHLEPSAVKSVGIGGFSAFHGLANELLKEPESRKRINVVYLADACFGGTAPKEPKQGYFAYATEAFKRNKLMIATTSGQAGVPVTYTYEGRTVTHGSGHDCVRQLYEAVQSAVPRTERVPELPLGLPEPVRAVQAGNFIWLDYGTRISHAEHATKIMAPMLQHYAVGWMASKRMPRGKVEDAVYRWIAGLSGAAAGYYLGKRASKGMWK
jgi:hypothetical protein